MALEIRRVAGKYTLTERLNENEYIEMLVDRIRTHTDGRMTAKFFVKAVLKNGSANLHQGQLNLMATRSRTELSRTLSKRLQPEGVNWDQLIEEACQLVVENEEQTTEASRLQLVEPKDPDFICYPHILERLPTLWYGPGAAGKTMLAMYFSFLVQNGLPFLGREIKQRNVLYLDWEVDEEEAGRRMSYFYRNFEKDQNIEMPYYRRCVLPIFDEASEIAEDVEKNDIGLVIVDSAGPACGGDVGNLERSVSYFNALRKITAPGNVGSVTLTHVTKLERREGGKARLPIGAVYFENIPRATWELRPQEVEDEEKEISVGFFCRKSNFKYPQPFGVNLHFNDITAKVEPMKPEDMLTEEKALEQMIIEELAAGPQKPIELAEKVGTSANTCRVVLSRLAKKGKVTNPERGKWALASIHQEAPF